MKSFQSMSMRCTYILLGWCYFVVFINHHAFGQERQQPFLFSLPTPGTPTTVQFGFELEDINYINSVEETFEFTGVMTLIWKDPRVAFEPGVMGAPEVIYQGNFQFDEIAAGWYPQVVLVNDAGGVQRNGVQLRIMPDGTSILKKKITAVAETSFNMRSFPFDAHHLEAAFAILGHTSDEIELRAMPLTGHVTKAIEVPEWSLIHASLSIREREVSGTTQSVVSQQAVFGIDASRQSFFVRRLVMLPMAVIAMLSFSIFWMDRSSLSDRNSVSFIGVLTAVAYQQIVVNVMPPVSYPTFLHGALLLSFMIMSLTVPINLTVAELDKRGKQKLGDRIDHTGRWLFPSLYFLGLLGIYILARRM